METILHTRHLDAGYGSHAVIKDINIQALRGQTICLAGPNGAGKSTILRTLCALLAPVSGCVYIGGEELFKLPPADRARRLAVVLTEKQTGNRLTVYEAVAMGRMPYTGLFGVLSEKDRRAVEACLRTVGVWELRDRDCAFLSDGEKQKVMIARALAQEPELLVLDEPTSHLDIRHKIEVIKLLNRLARERGLTVLMALHDIDIALKFCQTLLLVKEGRVVFQGRPEEMTGHGTIGDFYDIDGAFYDASLGSVEMYNEAPPEVFVAAGGGRGIPVYRILSRMGIGTATGILAENDVDCAVASAMRLHTIAGKSFEVFSEAQEREAWSWIQRCPLVIDTGFPVGSVNAANQTLLQRAAGEGRTILCLRSPEEGKRIYGEKTQVHILASMSELAEKLTENRTGGEK